MSLRAQNAQDVVPPLDYLNPSNFVKPKLVGLERLGLVKTPKKMCALMETDVVKISPKERTVFPLNLVEKIKDIANYKYMMLLACVISGRWHVPNTVKGEVFLSLMDKRLTDEREATILTANANPSVSEFQIRIHPNYSMVASDAIQEPLELFVHVKGLRMAQGFSPLSLEIAFCVVCCDVVIVKSLKMKILQNQDKFGNAEGEVGSEGLDDLLRGSNMPSIRASAVGSRKRLNANPKRVFSGSKGNSWSEKGNYVGVRKKKGVVESDMLTSDAESTVSNYSTDVSNALPTNNDQAVTMGVRQLGGLPNTG
ncbi:34 kDa movement protein [Maracuja mosaic virus]|uniref:Movement protein n=1 Tax=Maracuja mosaic virus TaxID=368736 RepID=A0SEL3_9VIRU|nr:34 kDa movement protein [Maracuja mosaic virus]ABD94120.1 34 kDa movement protein [Maracuja mosaic virus]